MKSRALHRPGLVLLLALLAACAATPGDRTPPPPTEPLPCRENIDGIIVERQPPCTDQSGSR